MSKNVPAERTLRDIRRKTRKQYTAEEKIRIVVSGCPSSKQMGLLSVFHKGGSGSSLFDVTPLGVGGSSGGFGWSVFDPFSLFDDGGVASKVVRIMDERAPKPGRPKTYNKISN